DRGRRGRDGRAIRPRAAGARRRLSRLPGGGHRPLSPRRPIKTPFGFDSTAAEVVEGVDLSGKRAIVTGGSSGIGVETARALASAGAEVTLAVRDTDAGERTAADITASTGNPAMHVGRLELADQ